MVIEMYKKNFDKLCKERGLAASTVMKAINLSHVAYQKWTDETRPRPSTQKKIADYFGVPQDWFWEDHTLDNVEDIPFRNASPADEPEGEDRLPVYGSISAGRGILAVEDIIGWAYADEQYHDGQHFWLSVSGVSMEPELHSGDLVLIRRQPTLDNGQIGAFLFGGEGFVKKYLSNGDVKLHSLNPIFPDIVITPECSDQFQIIGKVVEARHKYD